MPTTTSDVVNFTILFIVVFVLLRLIIIVSVITPGFLTIKPTNLRTINIVTKAITTAVI